jgi:hypothetical protein
LPHFG